MRARRSTWLQNPTFDLFFFSSLWLVPVAMLAGRSLVAPGVMLVFLALVYGPHIVSTVHQAPRLPTWSRGRLLSIAVPAVLAAYNWPTNTDRYRKLALFVDAFFAKFPTFQNPPFHPKWKETSLSAPLPGWQRLPAAQQWLDSHGIEQGIRSRFESFLQQNPAAARSAQSEADKEALFRQFQAWQADQASKDAQAQAQATDRPARRPRNQQ